MNSSFTTSYDVWDFVRKTNTTKPTELTVVRHVDLSNYKQKFCGYMLGGATARDNNRIDYYTRRSFFDSIDGLNSYLESCPDGSLVVSSATIEYTMVHTTMDVDYTYSDIDVPFIKTTVIVAFGSSDSKNSGEQ